jgi:hypothetical protein
MSGGSETPRTFRSQRGDSTAKVPPLPPPRRDRDRDERAAGWLTTVGALAIVAAIVLLVVIGLMEAGLL